MKEKLSRFIVSPDISVSEALKKIDENKKGFVLVLDENDVVLGTLTDGDIRRFYLKENTFETGIEGAYKKKYIALTVDDGLSLAIDLFKNNSIEFLPILDENKRLVNIITKRQMHSLLLQDIQADLTYDFLTLDEDIVDYEIFQRPWGFYKTTVFNEYFQSKVISVRPNSQLSLQSHNHREEHWVVVHGEGTVQIGESVIEVKCGSYLFIPKGCKHRLVNSNDKESLIITEVQIGDYLGEDDIIRYEDIYGRA